MAAAATAICLTQYNTAYAKDLKLVYENNQSHQLPAGHREVTHYSSAKRCPHYLEDCEKMMLTLEFLPTKVSKL